MRKSSARLVMVVFVVLAVSGGCKRDGLVTVAGQVSVNNQPLHEGIIDFRPADGKTATAATLVLEGKYTCKVPPGMKKVVISGYQVNGKEHASPGDPNSPLVDHKDQILPDRYSDEGKTELTADVVSSNRKLDFQLTAP